MAQIAEELDTATFHIPTRMRKALEESGRMIDPNDQKKVLRVLTHEGSLHDFWRGGELFRLIGGELMDACGISGTRDDRQRSLITLEHGNQFARAKCAKRGHDPLDPDQRSIIQRSGSWRIELIGKDDAIHIAEVESETQSDGHGKSHQTTVNISQNGRLKYIGDRTLHQNGAETGIFEHYYTDKQGESSVELGRRVSGKKQLIGHCAIDLSVFQNEDTKFAIGVDRKTGENHPLLLDRHYSQYLPQS
jgi:hypothetical protein